MYDPPMRLTGHGVPVLSKIQLDKMAEKYVSDFRSHVPQREERFFAESFAEQYLGLHIDYRWLSNTGCYLGMMIFVDDTPVDFYLPEKNKAATARVNAKTIIIDNSLMQGGHASRVRFTTMHECAHYLLHGNYFRRPGNGEKQNVVLCKRESIEGIAVKPFSEWTDKDRMEWQANYLAAAILTPVSEVDQWIRENDEIGYFKYRRKNGMSVDRAFKMAASGFSHRFGVSTTTATIRLQSLGFLQKTSGGTLKGS
jgi:Zn-dependent peptidase ImmA (M78 family)